MMISRNIIGRVGRVDYSVQPDDYFTRVSNVYVEIPTLGIATAERRAADGAQCVPGPFLLRTTFKYYLYIEFRFSSSSSPPTNTRSITVNIYDSIRLSLYSKLVQ
jgi:hypothetical protein